ncbi:MAG: 16S rRNA (uracil1498-N3)-methyltransferase [Arenicella sp.]|jgi:16S rRNA (uracil1498-N3)-methyltransferase
MLKSKHTFFCSDLNFGLLDEGESLHATKVMRLKEGDQINIIDGNGRSVEAKITSTVKKEVGFEVINEDRSSEHPLPLTIAIAPTKSIDRFSFFLEKCTEMGIKEVIPIESANSERKRLRKDKAEKVAIGALKQSGNRFLPHIHEMISFKEMISKDYGEAVKLIAHCEDDNSKKTIENTLKVNQSSIILIGPEGDFSPEEINLAKENGFTPISLGKSRLRTETAGILACHSVYLLQ